jgi:GT2 family glycosyltransferase
VPPAVAVVVATHERPARLARLLAALRAQTLSPQRFEVVIVDDGSGPSTAAVLDAERSRARLDLRALRLDRPLGPAGARNRGWRAARAPLIAFTDDDCAPAPGWLQAALEAARRNPGAIVQGRTLPDPTELGGRPLTERTIRIEALALSFQTCNMLYPRDLLKRLGGFDEHFGPRSVGEDTELAWRALRSGAKATFASGALVHHAVEQLGYLGTLRDAGRWAEVARLFSLQPAARAILDHRVFWNVWHYLLVRSLLALAAPAWLRRALLRRHLGALRRRAASAGAGRWAVPYLLLYDTIELGAVLRGAARQRTLVL